MNAISRTSRRHCADLGSAWPTWRWLLFPHRRNRCLKPAWWTIATVARTRMNLQAGRPRRWPCFSGNGRRRCSGMGIDAPRGIRQPATGKRDVTGGGDRLACSERHRLGDLGLRPAVSLATLEPPPGQWPRAGCSTIRQPPSSDNHGERRKRVKSALTASTAPAGGASRLPARCATACRVWRSGRRWRTERMIDRC